MNGSASFGQRHPAYLSPRAARLLLTISVARNMARRRDRWIATGDRFDGRVMLRSMDRLERLIGGGKLPC